MILGEWKWIDGTPCTRNDGFCSDLFDTLPDNVGDVFGLEADCVFFSTFGHLTEECGNAIPPGPRALCNKPIQ